MRRTRMLCTHCGNESLAPLRRQSWLELRGSIHHITRLQHSLSTLPDSDFPTLARLASGGWQTLTGWDSNRLDSKANFTYGGCPILSQRSRLGLAPSDPLW